MSESQLPNRLESLVRRFFERVGGALDFALRRPLNPQARTDLTALLPQIERAIEAKLRREPNRVVAPNLIELKYDYETYGQMNDARRAYLEKEIAASLYEYAVNHRYTLLGKMAVKLTFDVFTRQLTIKAAFPDEAEKPETAKAANESAPAALPAASVKLILRASGHSELSTTFTDRAAVGRSHDNALCLNDSSVSSFHAVFTVGANGGIWLTDIGSSNGTFVNGVRIAEGDKTIVRDGDRVQFGDFELKLELR
ncbi:MAG: FHA domain-containing protein [Acidobacteria bacterium]|nr:FHA domain-containing protein [Acidobacteriota bacterium]